ncbi:MAG TPA: plastocyanin/azurin family copper-binding protein [Gaiellaceae bacterium]|nr:plastocyanin/azurin family copper-binding protein [Gaiellaceae bacterium]
MFKGLFAAVVIAALVAVPAYANSSAVKLSGEVGPGYTIDVEKAGKDLKAIKAGTYKIKVEDKSSIHNFHLMGPGLNKKTSVSFQGEATWTIKLKPGKYTYQCDVHAADGMKGTFKVTR